MMYVQRSLRLYLSNRSFALLTPLFILLGMTGVSIALALVMGIPWGLPLPPDVQEGFRYNQGSIYSLPGFLISAGALAMNRNFAMSMAFGSTRRHFWVGTSLGFAVTSLVTAVGSIGFLALELATDHWFIGARAFDVAVLGDGAFPQTFAMIFMMSLLSLYLGALFGTTFRAFGTVWTSVLAVVFGLVILGLVTLTVWQWALLLPLVTTLGLWVAPSVAAIVVVVAAAGSYSVNRHATV